MAVTKTLKTSGGDYTSIATWESWAQGAYDATEAYNLEISGGDYGGTDGALEEEVDITGWTDPTATYPVSIYPATASDGHQGVVGDGFIYRSVTAAARVIKVQEPHFHISGFTVINGNSGIAIEIITATNGPGGTVINNMIVQTTDATNSSNDGIRIATGGTPTVLPLVYNNLAIDCYKGIVCSAFRRCLVYNNTAIDCTYGIYIDKCNSPSEWKNNVAYNSTTEDFSRLETSAGTFTNNASGDSTVTTYSLGTVTGVVGTTGVDFIDYASGDYTPASGGKLSGAGTDLSGTFTDDITGATR